MKKSLVLVFVLFVLVSLFYAQNRKGLVTKPIESTGSVILSTGVVYCAGDAWESPLKKSILNGCNYDFEVGFRQMFPKDIGYRVTLQYGSSYADDGDGKHHGRGLYRSTTNMFELTGRIEQQYIFGPKYHVYKRNSIYAFFGGGIMMGKVSYPTEAYVGYPDFRSGILSFGMGYTYNINEKFFIGTEFSVKYALSDKIDGYPLIVKPGDKKINDALGNFNIMLGLKVF